MLKYLFAINIEFTSFVGLLPSLPDRTSSVNKKSKTLIARTCSVNKKSNLLLTEYVLAITRQTRSVNKCRHVLYITNLTRVSSSVLEVAASV